MSLPPIHYHRRFNYLQSFLHTLFNSDIINQIYNKIDPHPTMKHIKFVTDGKKGLRTHIYTYDDSENNAMSPVLYLSSAQVNILSLCIFLAKVLSEKNTTFNTIFMDDPIQHLDGINLLAFIDVLRTITTKMGRQIIISTHNEYYPPWEPPVSRLRATRKWYFPSSEPPQHIVAAHIFDFTINLLIVILGELQMQYHQIIYKEVFLCLRRQKSEVSWNFWEKI